MTLKVLFTGFGEKTVEEHAQEAVRRILRYSSDPNAPMIPSADSALVQRECEGWDEEGGYAESHRFWASVGSNDYLCPHHRQLQMEYEKRKRHQDQAVQLEAAEATGRALGEAIANRRPTEAF